MKTRPALLRPNLRSNDAALIARAADLNVPWAPFDKIVGASGGLLGKQRPLIRYINDGDLPNPPAPAWYLPDSREIYIHTDAAKLDGKTPRVALTDLHFSTDPKVARIVGLTAHELSHAAISDSMDAVIKAAPWHGELVTMLEELRVENYAVRRSPMLRRYLRASFALVLANLPDEFSSKAHVVRAWTITMGRTLGGIADVDETHAVDVAARTLLSDDIVDGLTDLLQEALTLHTGREADRARMVGICDEWKELVGDTTDEHGCTTCTRHAKPGERPDDTGKGDPAPTGEGDAEGDDTGGGAGSGKDGDPADEGDSEAPGEGGEEPGEPDMDWTGESGYGHAGADDPDADSDERHVGDEALSDEDAEFMKMLKRDLTERMQDEWSRLPEAGVKLASAAEWSTKVFGNRKESGRLSKREADPAMRQHVVQVAAALSNLALPAIAKTAKPSQLPPGRLRSREAVRASAERAQGKMVTARPWKGTVRRHTTARPLVVGIATDTSGSMRWAEDGVAEFAYVYANAGHRIGARTAAVTFGDHVHRIARPGEVMNHVLHKTASDSTEEFDQAMAALDGVLHLTTPGFNAARILLIVSDGALVKHQESDRAAEWVRRMDKAGTHVIWITDHELGASEYTAYTDWMVQAARTLPRFSVTAITRRMRHPRIGEAGLSVFDHLNRAALAEIKATVSA